MKLIKLIELINEWTGKVVSFVVFFIFLIILTEVILRYVFNSPTVWANESSQMIFGAYIVLSGGYVLLSNQHVNVDLVYSHLSLKGKAIADIITCPLFILFSGMMLYYSGSMAWESLTNLEHSQSAWNPPVYPVKLMIPLGASLLLMQGITKLIRNISIIIHDQKEPIEYQEKESL